MKICIITSEFPPNCGGIGIYCKEIADRLSGDNDITIITRGSRIPISTSLQGDYRIVRAFCPPFYPFHIYIQKRIIDRYCRELIHDFDIIHYNSPLIPTINLDIPKVATIHGTVQGGISASGISDLDSIMTKLFFINFNNIEERIILDSNIIIPISMNCKNELIEKHLFDNKEIKLLKNGVDSEFFYFKNQSTLEKGNVKLLYVGRLHSQKGLIDIIKSVLLLKKRGINVECRIVGSGPFETKIRNEIVRLGISECFQFFGHVSNREILRSIIMNSDIFLLPSLYEGLPTSLLEAMSCGLPCIATNVGGIPELIVDDFNGLLINPQSPIDISKKILYLLENNDVFIRLGKNARNTIESEYDWNIILKGLLDIYKRSDQFENTICSQ